MKDQDYIIAVNATNKDAVNQEELETGFPSNSKLKSPMHNLYHNYTSEQLYNVVQELKNVLAAAGLTPDNTENQLIAALNSLYRKGWNTVYSASMSGGFYTYTLPTNSSIAKVRITSSQGVSYFQNSSGSNLDIPYMYTMFIENEIENQGSYGTSIAMQPFGYGYYTIAEIDLKNKHITAKSNNINSSTPSYIMTDLGFNFSTIALAKIKIDMGLSYSGFLLIEEFNL